MKISAPVQAAGASLPSQSIEAAMLRKGKEHVELQGQQALQLISSAAQPAKAASGHLGTNLNVLA